jgi:hypothetical protein
MTNCNECGRQITWQEEEYEFNEREDHLAPCPECYEYGFVGEECTACMLDCPGACYGGEPYESSEDEEAAESKWTKKKKTVKSLPSSKKKKTKARKKKTIGTRFKKWKVVMPAGRQLVNVSWRGEVVKPAGSEEKGKAVMSKRTLPCWITKKKT